ncbi:hypothetical protein FO519_009229, partial [Halicephalobus sp. NKZ332]
DIVLISHSTTELQEMLTELAHAGNSIGLTINKKKTQLMKNVYCQGPEIILDGHPLEETESYTYLGKTLASDCSLAEELRRRRKAAWRAFGSIKEVTGYLSDPITRASLFNAHVLPAFCYASETWALTPSTISYVERTYRGLERALIRVSRHQQWKERWNNDYIRQRSGVIDVTDYIYRAKHRWAGHVMRRTDDRWNDSLLHLSLQPTTLPRTATTRPTRTPYIHWSTRAQDRKDWKQSDPRGSPAEAGSS